MNDLVSVRLALEVERQGSFVGAARAMDLEPSQVSRLIARLESDLGFRLFQRSTRRLATTEAGAAYLARAGALLEGFDHARDEARALNAEPEGVLRLTASVAFGATWIVPLLGDFRAKYPKVGLDLLFTDASLDLVAERVDLAVRLAPMVRADVISSKLMDTRYRVVASPSWVAATGGLDSPDALSRQKCLLFDLPGYRKTWRFRDRRGGIEEIAVSGDMTFSSAFALFAAAKLGLGPALLPDWLTRADLMAHTLVDLLPEHEASAADFDSAAWLLYPSRAYLPLKVRIMIDFLRAHAARTKS